MGMRKTWQDAKDKALREFKAANPPGRDVHINGAKPYPLKFKEDLGPTLDNVEKTSNLGNLEKYTQKAKDVIKSYRTEIAKNAHDLGTNPTNTLNHALDSISRDLEHKGF